MNPAFSSGNRFIVGSCCRLDLIIKFLIVCATSLIFHFQWRMLDLRLKLIKFPNWCRTKCRSWFSHGAAVIDPIKTTINCVRFRKIPFKTSRSPYENINSIIMIMKKLYEFDAVCGIMFVSLTKTKIAKRGQSEWDECDSCVGGTQWCFETMRNTLWTHGRFYETILGNPTERQPIKWHLRVPFELSESVIYFQIRIELLSNWSGYSSSSVPAGIAAPQSSWGKRCPLNRWKRATIGLFKRAFLVDACWIL